jgi:hypothetical protein|tara:strand:- start:132 stop:314 length:183 start_codon:yes stop_codon:yes gene_type:complete
MLLGLGGTEWWALLLPLPLWRGDALVDRVGVRGAMSKLTVVEVEVEVDLLFLFFCCLRSS